MKTSSIQRKGLKDKNRPHVGFALWGVNCQLWWEWSSSHKPIITSRKGKKLQMNFSLLIALFKHLLSFFLTRRDTNGASTYSQASIWICTHVWKKAADCLRFCLDRPHIMLAGIPLQQDSTVLTEGVTIILFVLLSTALFTTYLS